MICRPAFVFLILIAGWFLGPPSFAEADQGASVLIPKIEYKPFFKEAGESDKLIGPLQVDKYPVTNTEFAEFVKQNPKWSPSRIKSLFADSNYLNHWKSDTEFDSEIANHPVTQVSWFAARQYCKSQGKRLLTVSEWEAVSDSQDAENLDLILKWYARPTTDNAGGLTPVSEAQPNIHGLHGMHGLIWEWVDDFSSVIISGDSRGSNDTKGAKFCGSGSLRAKDPTEYATFMRYAHRSSLSAAYTGGTLGFRCVK